MISIKIDDKQIQSFLKKSPKRAEWALKESLSKAGGHVRKSLRAHVETHNYAPLHPVTKKGRQGGAAPLFNIGKWVSFKYGKRKGIQQVQIGWLGKGKPALVRKLFYGKRFRATPKIRALFHHRGVHLKKKTKMLEVPQRPALDLFWARKAREMPGYVEYNFFKKFFSKENTRLSI